MIPKEKLAEWRGLLRAATPGPWEASGNTVDGGEWACETVVGMRHAGHSYMTYDELDVSTADADFIAASPTMVAELLDEVERLQRELDSLKEQMYDQELEAWEASTYDY